jgi:hypothetical protein
LELSSLTNTSHIHLLVDGLLHNSTLTSLKLPRIGLKTPESTAPFCQLIQGHLSLQFLDLSFCNVSGTSAEILGISLANNSVLSKLYLINSSIDPKACQFISKGLSVNNSLETLLLGCNKLGNSGVKSLCEALYHNTTLMNLSLMENQVGDEGIKCLTQLVHRNRTIRQLDIYNNSFTEFSVADAEIRNLSEAMESNYGILHVFIEVSGFSTSYPPIKQICETNRENSKRHASLFELLMKNLNNIRRIEKNKRLI